MGNLHDCSNGGLLKSSRRPQISQHVERVEQHGGVVENEQVEQHEGVVENDWVAIS
jgi:hypothetical protein